MERRRPDVPRPGASLTLTGAMSRHAAAMAARQARLGMAADCRRQPAGRASSAGQTACWPWSLTATIQVLSSGDSAVSRVGVMYGLSVLVMVRLRAPAYRSLDATKPFRRVGDPVTSGDPCPLRVQLTHIMVLSLLFYGDQERGLIFIADRDKNVI